MGFHEVKHGISNAKKNNGNGLSTKIQGILCTSLFVRTFLCLGILYRSALVGDSASKVCNLLYHGIDHFHGILWYFKRSNGAFAKYVCRRPSLFQLFVHRFHGDDTILYIYSRRSFGIPGEYNCALLFASIVTSFPVDLTQLLLLKLVMAASAVQLVCLFWYLISFLPGGAAGLQYVFAAMGHILKPALVVCAQFQAVCVAKCFGWMTTSSTS
jgi:hypothetical protein